MIVITSSDLARNVEKYMDIAETEQVYVERKNKYIRLAVSKKRPPMPKNPDNPSPSGDPYFDDPRNIEDILKSVQQEGKGTVLKTDEDIRNFFDRL
jgi:hypothetical protein